VVVVQVELAMVAVVVQGHYFIQQHLILQIREQSQSVLEVLVITPVQTQRPMEQFRITTVEQLRSDL
jgi:hypothetical protein